MSAAAGQQKSLYHRTSCAGRGYQSWVSKTFWPEFTGASEPHRYVS